MYKTELTANEKRIQELETENATLKAVAEHHIKQLEAENAALKKQIAVAEPTSAEAAKPAQPAEPVHPFPNGFTARVQACSTEEKALKNVLFYNPGHPFEGADWMYVYPNTFRGLSAVLRLVYDPTTPEGCVEVGAFQREYFNLTLGASVKFERAGTIPELTSCTIRISRLGQKARTHFADIPVDPVCWAKTLNGMACEIGCPLAVKGMNSLLYKIVPEASRPGTSGVFTKNTILTIMTEDDIN
jgi:hypothetical protein